MPDWLSNPEPGAAESVSQDAGIPPAESDKSLAPVDLPSWVQAMRPVEAAISESTPSVADQPVEQEGPLAGLQGVIPIAPIGSSRRPRAIPLKLQVSDEQQASAALLEQILGTENQSSYIGSIHICLPSAMVALGLDRTLSGCIECCHLFPDAVHAGLCRTAGRSE